MGVYIIILFYLIYPLILFALIYSSDTVDIANDDYEIYNPSINDLLEKKRVDTYTIDNYIKDTICPRYHHQILKNEIEDYQKKITDSKITNIVINILLCMIPAIIVNQMWGQFIIPYLVALIIGVKCYFTVMLIYKKYRRYSGNCIKNYYEIYSSYDWYNHYNYLLCIKNKIINRYMSRKIIDFLTILSYVIFISVGLWMHK